MLFAELLPLLPMILGSAAAGAVIMFGGSKLYAVLPSGKQKKRAAFEAESRQKWKEYSEGLLSHTDQMNHAANSSSLGRTAADHISINIQTSLAFRRGKTDEEKAKFEQRFSKTNYSQVKIQRDISEQLDSIYRNYLPLLTASQFAFYEREIQEEIRKSLHYSVMGWGLVITDLVFKVGSYSSTKSYLDASAMRRTPLNKVLHILPEPKIPDESESWKRKNTANSITEESADRSSDRNQVIASSTLIARLESLEDAWLEYELNPVLLLDYPLMVDASCDETAEFFFALKKVRNLRDIQSPDASVVAELATALDAAERAFIKAESNAKKQRHTHLSREQRAQIRSARPFVAMVKDEEASPQERANAYRKANDFLEGIMALPDKAVLGLLEQ